MLNFNYRYANCLQLEDDLFPIRLCFIEKTFYANFFINHGNASASDITELIRMAKRAVLEEFNIELELEIKTIGFEEDKI